MVQWPPAYENEPFRFCCLQTAVGPRVAWQSVSAEQLSPTRLGGAMQAPLSQTGVGAVQALQVSPLEPQMLLFCREEPRGWQVPFASRQPSQPAVPPAVPPPAPPAAPPPVPLVPHVKVVESQAEFVAEQSWQALPEVPHVVLFELFGFATHLPSLPQQPSQLAGLHGAGPHEH